jgi:serine/threonine-protein kinase
MSDPATGPEVEALLARYIERRLAGEGAPDLAEIVRDAPTLAPALRALVDRYESLSGLLALEAPLPPDEGAPEVAPPPSFPGFRTIERLGRGGGGEVYKLLDMTLGRVVAGKVLRKGGPLAAQGPGILREARFLALFEDPRIVRLLDYRGGDPPLLLMEYVDGFDLSAIGPSLEPRQKARILADVAGAVERAHELGIQHRDLKPGNILVDAALRPRILDFGISSGSADRGHGLGTLAYMAPEQLDPARPIDARTDVYALGVVLFELLCGERPFAAESDVKLREAIARGEPRLPREIDPAVPEPLQSIALTAMAADPADRYPTARELGADLQRYLEDRPVLARPAAYRSALARRVEPHLHDIDEWERLRLVYPHEGRRLREAYARLDSREGDWILGSRALSFSQIALYLGAFLLACGGVLYFGAYQKDGVHGLLHPTLFLAVPVAALAALALRLDRGEHKAAAVAFHLGAAVLVPPLLLILLREGGLFTGVAAEGRELFERVTNRQLQAALALSAAWIVFPALRTRTVALASAFALFLTSLHLSLLGTFGLRQWLEEDRWDTLALALLPLLLVASVLGRLLDALRRPFFAQPLYFLAAGLVVAAAELLALDGKAFTHLGLTLGSLQGESVSDPHLLDTVAAMTLNGVAFLGLGILVDRRGTALMKAPARLLEAISPYAILEPLGYLVHTGEYSRRIDWLFLTLSLAVAIASHFRQRRGFYTAGLINTGVAIALITDHYEWLGRVGWASSILAGGLAVLALGFALERLDRRRASSAGPMPPVD